MNCQEVRELLSPYIDDVLAPEDRQKVSAHMKECPECSNEYKSLVATVDQVRALGEIDPPHNFHVSLRSCLEKERKKKNAFYSWVPLGAAAVILLAVFLNFGMNSLRPSGIMEGTGGSPGMRSADIPLEQKNQETAEFKSAGEIAADQKSSPRGMGGLGAPPAADEVGIEGTKERLGIGAAVADRKVIKNALISIEVIDLDAAFDRLAKIAEDSGGYIQSSSTAVTDGDGERKTGNIILRVPQDAFSSVLVSISKLGDVVQKTVSGDDVTMEYFDTKARLKVLQKKENRLLELLGRAGKLEEILQVEDKLSEVRNEIEQLQGRLKFLNQSTAMATIKVNIKEKPSPDNRIEGVSIREIWDKTSAAFIFSFNKLINKGVNAVIAFGSILPQLITAAAAGVLLFIIGKRLMRVHRS